MANPYGLTREMADAIVKAVRANQQCSVLLPSVSAFKFFAPVGQAGTARNFANAWMQGVGDLTGSAGFQEAGRNLKDRWQQLGDRQACTGVAEATARVLTGVAGKPGYEFLIRASTQDRMPSDPPHDFHTATTVTVTNDRTYVFDWHSTLDIGNPLIFASVEAFKAGRNPVKYLHFWGWS